MSTSNPNPAKLIAQRVLARRRLIPYIKMMQPDYHAGWVHEDLAARLERFYEDVKLKKSPRLMVNFPPRGGKSVTASQHFPAWLYGQDPKIDIILSSYNVDLPLGFSRKIRGSIRDDATYQNTFPNTRLSKDSQSAETWATTEGGQFVATGIGGALTGRGCHVLIIDDYVKNAEEAANQKLHDQHLEWFQSTAYTRLAPGGGVLIIATRWSYTDLSGQLQQLSRDDPDADVYDVVEYPAISEQFEYRDRKTFNIRREEVALPPDEAVNYDLLRRPNEALHPERFTLAMLQRIRANLSKRIWSALYQQRPVPDDGLFFQKSYIRYMHHIPEYPVASVYTAFDFAVTTKNANDYSSYATLMQDPTGVLLVESIHHFKRDTYGIVNAIISEARRVQQLYPHYHQKMGFENGPIFQTILPVLKREMRKQRVFFTYILLNPLTDKQVRARPLQSLMEEGMLYFLSTLSELLEVERELLQFPVAKNDDYVDALAWGARMSLEIPLPTNSAAAKPKQEKSWKADLAKWIGSAKGNGKSPWRD